MITIAALTVLAGIFSTLSPCVLPLLPVVLGTAVSHHRLGPVALSLELGISFATIGLFVAVIGFSIGLDLTVFRMIGGVIMIGIGTVLMVPLLQLHLTSAASPFGNWTEQRYGNFDAGELKGQFLVGLLLGAVWSPCVGPTLGSASLLAASGKNLGQIAATMLIFGLGATLPLLLLGFLSRDMLLRSRSWLLSAGQGGKVLLGSLLIVVGLLIVSGLDKKVEAAVVFHSPAWLTALTTRF